MNAIDIAVVVVLLASGVFALMRGFVYEVLAVSGWVAAALGAFWGLPMARPLVRPYISNQTLADIAGGVAIFLAVLLLSSLITHAVSKRVQRSAIGSVDRSLGFAFGLVRGLVLCSLAYMVAAALIPPNGPDMLAAAKTRPLMETGARFLKTLVPSSVVGSVEDKAKEATDAANKAIETKEMYDRLQSPKPQSQQQQQQPSSPQQQQAQPQQGGDAKQPSYDSQGLERLIQTTK